MAHGRNYLSYRERHQLETIIQEHQAESNDQELAQIATAELKRPVTACNVANIRHHLGLKRHEWTRRVLSNEDVRRIEAALTRDGRVVVFKYNGHKLRLGKLEQTIKSVNRFNEAKPWNMRKAAKKKAAAVPTGEPNGLAHADAGHG